MLKLWQRRLCGSGGYHEGNGFDLENAMQDAHALMLRLLTRRIGELPGDLSAQIEALSLAQLDALGEVLLDLTSLADLQTWLKDNTHP
jgi:hypothetical protein